MLDQVAIALSCLALFGSAYSIYRGIKLEKLVRKVRLITPAPRVAQPIREKFQTQEERREAIQAQAEDPRFKDLTEAIRNSRTANSSIMAPDTEAQSNPTKWRAKHLKTL